MGQLGLTRLVLISQLLFVAVSVVPLREKRADRFSLLAENIVIVLVQIHYSFEVMLAALHTLNKMLIYGLLVIYFTVNLTLCLVRLSNQIINFVEKAPLFLLDLIMRLLDF